jgi:hypothetical protein
VKVSKQVALLTAGVLCVACSAPGPTRPDGSVDARAGAIPVSVSQQNGRYILLRGGVPYEVKGAGLEFGSVEALVAHGGNSLRTWRADNRLASGREVLDDAARHGATVALCIEIGRERHGFDYDDAAAVARQLEYARGEVLKYKDHPALLAWIIGNEVNLHFENPKVFDAVNAISRMIHDVDGLHPTTTALAGFGPELAGLISTRAPDLDFVSIQMYGDIVNLPRYLTEIGFDAPYFVTEWGATGHWEVPKTTWGAPIEQTSSEKARSYLRSYEVAIGSDARRVIGSYVFLWGQKQERTPTWYGMFLADGSETETIDVMHYIWNGEWPDNRAPQIDTFTFDSRTAKESVTLEAGAAYAAKVAASDPDGDSLRYRWEVMAESDATQQGGDVEAVPPVLPVKIEVATTAHPVVTTPHSPGAYRLFVYVYDGAGHAGHANIPFLVR